MVSSRDYVERLRVWSGFRKQTGAKMKNLYAEFVKLLNEAARDGGYKDAAESWVASYETDDFREELQRLSKQLRPLYENLHAYVRKNLQRVYSRYKFPSSGHIPAHLLGIMFAEVWSNVLPMVKPFPMKKSIDVTKKMLEKGYTPLRMFKISEEFFTSLGLLPMPPKFWNNSIIEKPADGRPMVCHASAWDFSINHDVRIKQCTETTQGHLGTVHHEMGHVEYFLQYWDQPVPFRGGANPGFHEAIGDVLQLSVSTPEHLHIIGLLDKVEDDKEATLNYLMSMALSKIAFLPFAYLMDLFRWDVFSGKIPDADHYNDAWWKLRCEMQGVSPPVKRTKDDFDAGAKYHIPANVPYIRYFVSYVIQFQFHKALCKEAGHTGPLYSCDIYRSKKAGEKLASALKLGSSEKWPVAMEKITGQRKMDAGPMMEYFAPLIAWLKEQNKGERIGWDPSCPNAPDMRT